MTLPRETTNLKADYGSTTHYGFTWGPMEVTRCARFTEGDRDTRCIQVKAGKRTLSVYVSRTGRSIRVFEDGQEWGPQSVA